MEIGDFSSMTSVHNHSPNALNGDKPISRRLISTIQTKHLYTEASSMANKAPVVSGDSLLDGRIEEWLNWDRNDVTKKEIETLIANQDFDKLKKVLLKRLKFGTAGLRGRMGAGFGCMNDLVIVQTAQGVIKYLEALDIDHLQKNGIVVGYDGRHNSKRFAELTAAVFLSKGYPVYLFSDLVPTPFVPFTVTKYNSIMGVMVTASHNPKDDNGYKVYAANGCQIISPADKEIQQFIMDNLEPLEESWDTSIVADHEKKIDPLPEVLDSYLEMISQNIPDSYKEINKNCKISFVYTPMHGVGQAYMEQVMKVIGLKIIAVEEQKKPDPEFPTVKLPNPEEGKNALNLAVATANKNNVTIILANDPDADRMACAEKNKNSGEWKIFTGNELGALLGWWALQNLKASNASSSFRDIFMIASTVSSKILKTMALYEGFNFIETLTGFKWMGNKAWSLRKAGQQTIFAFEEAIGYMWTDRILDKDGIQAAAQMATLAAYLKSKDMTINDQLEAIFKQYGYHLSLNSYYICSDPEIIARIFYRLRNYNREYRGCCNPAPPLLPLYPRSVGNGKYPIINVRDLTNGYDNSRENNKAILPIQRDCQMITFHFENGLVATLRTSGTEPKLKYYTEMIAKPGQGNREEIEELLKNMVQEMNEEFLEPDKNELQLPPP
ncbi:phosphopentomutase [Onthophagus taurus]|uniref:phosphopentomutase n=1 Tax=Onthophagus taurus TaxID=166361 RepID=UPI0039BDC7E9